MRPRPVGPATNVNAGGATLVVTRTQRARAGSPRLLSASQISNNKHYNSTASIYTCTYNNPTRSTLPTPAPTRLGYLPLSFPSASPSSMSFLRRISSKGDVPALNVPDGSDDERSRSRSRSRGRSMSPWRRSKRDESAEGIRDDRDHAGYESDGGERCVQSNSLPPDSGPHPSFVHSDSTPVVRPSNAFDSSDEEEEDFGELGVEEEELERNTEVSTITPLLSFTPRDRRR